MTQSNHKHFERLLELAQANNYPKFQLTLEDGREVEVTGVAVNSCSEYSSGSGHGQVDYTVEFSEDEMERADLKSNIAHLHMRQRSKTEYGDLQFVQQGTGDPTDEITITVDSLEVLEEDTT